MGVLADIKCLLLFAWQAHRAVQPDRAAVQVRIACDLLDSECKLIRTAKARWKRNVCGDLVGDILGQAFHHRGAEQAWSDRHDADA